MDVNVIITAAAFDVFGLELKIDALHALFNLNVLDFDDLRELSLHIQDKNDIVIQDEYLRSFDDLKIAVFDAVKYLATP